MIYQLKNIFSTFITDPADLDNPQNDYQWFRTENNELFGIAKYELTTKDKDLLNLLATPYEPRIPLPTAKEKMWKRRLNEQQTEKGPATTPFRFVYFSIKKNQIEPSLFKEAIQELFPQEIVILWENEQEGIMIEEQTNREDPISYDQIIEVLMSDLYVKINFFLGPFQTNLQAIARFYDSFLKSAKIAFTYTNKSVVTYSEAIPYMLIDQTEPHFKKRIARLVLHTFASDEDMLKTIEKLIDHNLNVSNTAKHLYMHRNSLQYRLDKFFQQTGFDVRQFHHAQVVYLAMIANININK